MDAKERLRRQALELIRYTAAEGKKDPATTAKTIEAIERQLGVLRDLGFNESGGTLL